MSFFETHKTRAGAFLFALLLFAAAIILLSQIGTETKFSTRGKLFAQPRFWPAIGLIGMAFFCGAYLATIRKSGLGGSRSEVWHWLRAAEYLIWFMFYVAAVPVLGYLLSTLTFTLSLSLRQGYGSKKMLLIALICSLAIVLVFKTGLSVKIPGGAIYDYLPSGLQSFMIVNF